MTDQTKRNPTKREPILWERAENNFVRCNICHNRCLIPPGAVSRCFSRRNVDGKMELNSYGIISSIAADPIEKKPLYHFHPGTKVLSVGGWGCNFRCKHCQNWQISQPEREKIKNNYLSPENLVELISKNNCQGLSWTYNEPAIWLEYTLDSAKLAKEHGFYTAYVTNGFITPEALDMLAPYLDAFRVDLKSFDDEFYREVCGVKSAAGVYESTLHAHKLGMHIEAVTNIIPTHNDSDENLKNIADWMVKNLGADTPWHVTRFYPCFKLSNLPPTPIETLDRAVEIGRAQGLNFVYKGNVREETDTVCPDCGKVAISRMGYSVNTDFTPDGKCSMCGRDLNIKDAK